MEKEMKATKTNIRTIVKRLTKNNPPKFEKDTWGGYKHIQLANGLKLMKTDNANYGGGFSNGFGKGVYAIAAMCGMEATVKIA